MRQAEALLIKGRTAAMSGRGARIREAAGLSQSELARMVGVTPAALNRWEAGTRAPSGPSAVAYAKTLAQVAREVVR